MAFGGGYLIVAMGYRTLFLVSAGLTLAGALLFFAYFRIPRGALARPPLAEAVDKTFGSQEKFQQQLTEAGLTQFGSGWAWLVKTSDGKLEIVKTSNAGNPLTDTRSYGEAH